MKRYLLLLGAFFAFNALWAQYVDFGPEYGFWKGDFAVADIDNDGDLDIIFSGSENGVEKGAVMINDGAGNFTPQAGERIFKIGQGGNIKFGDIDGDGDLDIIFVGWGDGSTAESRGIALNDGQGVYTLASSEQYPINTAPKVTSAGFADFNLDGLLDYYFFGNGIGNCIIYMQQANGTFVGSSASFNDIKLNEPEVTVVDFDNDGTPDIFMNGGDESVADGQNKRFSFLFKNDGYANFTKFAGVDLFRRKSNGTSSWGDFNGDGYLDLLLNGDGYLDSGENSDRMVRVYKNLNGTSSEVGFEVEIARQGSMGNGSVVVDWNNDGKLDFIAAGWNGTKQATELYLGDNPAAFTFARSPLGDTQFPGVSEQGLRVADLNGDNKVDLLMSGYSGGTLALNRRIAGYVLNQSPNASVPPVAPTNLKTEIDESDGVMITFSWDAPASENGKYGTSYNISLKNTTTGKWLYNPMAVVGGDKNGWRKVAGRMGNVYVNKEFYLYDIPSGSYEWTVQAINGAYLGGAFAATKTFSINSTGTNPEKQFKLKVYSSDKKITVNGDPGSSQSVNLYGISGTLLNSKVFTQDITLEVQSAGIYIIEIVKADGATYRTKVAVN